MRTRHRITNASVGKLFSFCFDSIFFEPTAAHTPTYLHTGTGDTTSYQLQAKGTHLSRQIKLFYLMQGVYYLSDKRKQARGKVFAKIYIIGCHRLLSDNNFNLY